MFEIVTTHIPIADAIFKYFKPTFVLLWRTYLAPKMMKQAIERRDMLKNTKFTGMLSKIAIASFLSLNIPKSKIVSVISKITMKMKLTTMKTSKKQDATMCLALFDEMQKRIPTKTN